MLSENNLLSLLIYFSRKTGSGKSDKENSYVAFNIIGVIFAISSLVLMLLLLFLCADRYKPMMLSVIACTAMSSESVY